ncbi:HAMP domain-containing histidine kinase [Paracrocinitomix mangrovi]|uniref:sensor histidine kinase n=1 Tax=Paracrocinitomix mangrovi TaxID=2862509 RepID=UPI001C8E2E8B|nr:HAMP domain-containing sensor histidine kinase [Paracrocinitomix mangrovi]UKN02065.1 HAMP domain-containing histidine kinase [Paracrocinitomix mangrovi]
MLKKILAIGDKPTDSESIKQKHSFMVYMGLVMGFGGLVWGILATALGYPIPGIFPFSYTFITIINFWFFSKNKNFKVASAIQVFISLLLPFVFQWSLGGFLSSGAMMLWASLAVIGSLSFYDTKASRVWIALFVVFTIVSGVIDPYLVDYRPDVTPSVQVLFFVVNIIIISTAVYYLVVFFINIRDNANAQLEQQHKELQQSQSQLIQSEKLAALGQLIAGVAHEVNTPLGAIQASIGTIRSAIKSSIKGFPEVLGILSLEEKAIFFMMLEDAFSSTSNISSAEQRKIRRGLMSKLEDEGFENADEIAEMMVDIGLYELKDDYLPLLKGTNSGTALDLIYNQTEQCKNSDNIKMAVDRASKIVFALKNYSRFDHSGEKTEADIENGIETILTLYHNMIKKGIDIERDFDSLEPIACYPDELNQVWTNLIHNAIQAMNNEGQLTISIKKDGDMARVDIADSGKGIPEDIKNRIFEPFFTTKPAGEGSGLGLDIVKKIVEKHSGTITVESEPGKTVFTVKLPYAN